MARAGEQRPPGPAGSPLPPQPWRSSRRQLPASQSEKRGWRWWEEAGGSGQAQAASQWGPASPLPSLPPAPETAARQAAGRAGCSAPLIKGLGRGPARSLPGDPRTGGRSPVRSAEQRLPWRLCRKAATGERGSKETHTLLCTAPGRGNTGSTLSEWGGDLRGARRRGGNPALQMQPAARAGGDPASRWGCV